MEKKDIICVRLTCLDFSKAFDKVHHHRLINILHQARLNKGFLKWLHSFLTNRFQRISFEGLIGQLMEVSSGVPQGSVLAPYLFALFIGNLHVEAPNAHLVKFADDLTLIEYCSKSDPNPNHLLAVEEWIEENKMYLNKRKCRQMIFRRTRSMSLNPYPNIELCPDVNILGVTFSDSFSWDNHFDAVILKASRRLHTLRGLKPFVTKKQLIEVYNGFIMSVLTYASPVFCKLSASTVTKLSRLRRRAHRIICDPLCNCSAVPDPIRVHRQLLRKFLVKCNSPAHALHHLVPPKLNSGRYCAQFCSTSRRQNSFFPYACLLSNSEMSR